MIGVCPPEPMALMSAPSCSALASLQPHPKHTHNAANHRRDHHHRQCGTISSTSSYKSTSGTPNPYRTELGVVPAFDP